MASLKLAVPETPAESDASAGMGDEPVDVVEDEDRKLEESEWPSLKLCPEETFTNLMLQMHG